MAQKKSSVIALSGRYELQTDADTTWKNLTEAEVLSFCIKGCDQVIHHGDGKYSASFTFGFGPIKKTVTAELRIEDVNPPENYMLLAVLETTKLGQAGGKANVSLITTDGGCDLCYEADVEVSGWFDAFSENVIRRAANRTLVVFFDRFVTFTRDRSE